MLVRMHVSGPQLFLSLTSTAYPRARNSRAVQRVHRSARSRPCRSAPDAPHALLTTTTSSSKSSHKVRRSNEEEIVEIPPPPMEGFGQRVRMCRGATAKRLSQAPGSWRQSIKRSPTARAPKLQRRAGKGRRAELEGPRRPVAPTPSALSPTGSPTSAQRRARSAANRSPCATVRLASFATRHSASSGRACFDNAFCAIAGRIHFRPGDEVEGGSPLGSTLHHSVGPCALGSGQ